MSKLPLDYFEPILSCHPFFKWQRNAAIADGHLRVCRICDEDFIPKRKTQTVCTGGPTCVERVSFKNECRVCGSDFQTHRLNSKYCSAECRKAIQRLRERISQRKRRAKIRKSKKRIAI